VDSSSHCIGVFIGEITGLSARRDIAQARELSRPSRFETSKITQGSYYVVPSLQPASMATRSRSKQERRSILYGCTTDSAFTVVSRSIIKECISPFSPAALIHRLGWWQFVHPQPTDCPLGQCTPPTARTRPEPGVYEAPASPELKPLLLIWLCRFSLALENQALAARHSHESATFYAPGLVRGFLGPSYVISICFRAGMRTGIREVTRATEAESFTASLTSATEDSL